MAKYLVLLPCVLLASGLLNNVLAVSLNEHHLVKRQSPGPPGRPGSPGLPGEPGVRGPTGPSGERGPAGEPGPAGPRGLNGNDGRDGAHGRPGDRGPQGEPGPVGLPGVPGIPPNITVENGTVVITGPPGPRGEPGRPGARGEQGRTGSTGPQGPEGPRGNPGDRGGSGPQGSPGRPGDRGPPGRDGNLGRDGVPGTPGRPGPPGRDGVGGGVNYVRWGKMTCSNATEGTTLVYAGRAVGSRWNSPGGTSDILCLPDIPEYGEDFQQHAQRFSTLQGVEFETFSGSPLEDARDHNVPCAVCHMTGRSSVLEIPARRTCPSTWTKEYEGFLVAGYAGDGRISAKCVDGNPDFVRGEARNTNGALFYHVEVACNGIQCPPYDPQKELTCVVCSK